MKFYKFNASGNDFVILNEIPKDCDFKELAIKICDRYKGVGADGMIIILDDDEFDFRWVFFNSDGSEADMCGNGSRSAIMYTRLINITDKNNIKFRSNAGIIEGEIINFINHHTAEICIKLPKPQKIMDPFEEFGFNWHFYNTGVPHLVTFVDDLDKFDIKLCKDLRYKYDANINFAKISSDKIFLRTYERGVENETLSCGTGMGACFWANYINNHQSNMTLIPKNNDIIKFFVIDDTMKFQGIVHNTFIGEFFL